MARNGRRKQPRRRKDNRINILQVAESFFYGNLISGYAFGTSLPGFFLDKPGAPGESLQDILQNPEQATNAIGARLMDVDRTVNVVIKAGIAGITFNVVQKALKKPRAKVNAGMKQLGLPVKL
jgi:hypothetical protein